ncbi:hypothetical protein EVAR_89917_1 [Eumeta japonica]|uniref:PiggyBac transposable element-derived protein 4 n=1 Tax=Eumeta variegata TaxID=151549 RepID=A0A4C1XN13_EUMVA|nr:hypothetical protein EVAR_89917_1 [Eumeta japonica]
MCHLLNFSTHTALANGGLIQNAGCICSKCIHHQQHEPISEKVFRLNFMKRLAEDLIEPHLRRRVNQFGLQRELQNAIRRVLKIDEQPSTSSAGSSDKLESRKTCSTCDPKKKRKTFHLCFQCKIQFALSVLKKCV